MRPSAALAAHRDAIDAIVAKHKARNPRVFGSVARGDDREDSDLDLLVDPEPGMDLFDLARIIHGLESLLGIPVDVLMADNLSEKFAARLHGCHRDRKVVRFFGAHHRGYRKNQALYEGHG